MTTKTTTTTHKHCNVYRNKTIENLKGNLPFHMKKLSLPNGISMKISVVNVNDATVHLFFNHNFEYRSVSPIMKMMHDDPSLHFIDIGANQGFFTLPIATLARNIVAVEAVDEVCERNYASQYANKVNKYVTLVNNAISDRREIVNMSVNLNQHSGGSAIVDFDNVVVKITKNVKIKKVKSILMDDLLEVIDFKKAIMKIDIEGAEAKALRGATKLFDTIDIPMVLLEWNWVVKNPSYRQEIVNFFQKRNYKPFKSVTNNQNSQLDFSHIKKWPLNIVWKK